MPDCPKSLQSKPTTVAHKEQPNAFIHLTLRGYNQPEVGPPVYNPTSHTLLLEIGFPDSKVTTISVSVIKSFGGALDCARFELASICTGENYKWDSKSPTSGAFSGIDSKRPRIDVA
jgi:hypothetical protein